MEKTSDVALIMEMMEDEEDKLHDDIIKMIKTCLL